MFKKVVGNSDSGNINVYSRNICLQQSGGSAFGLMSKVF